MKVRNCARSAVAVIGGVLVLSVLALVAMPDVAAAVETITLRSGNAPAYSPDPFITMLTGTPGGIDALNSPGSALYCQSFDIQTCCIESATLSFCWSADDNLGDALYGGANPDGVYLNGVAVSPSITGGSYATETQVGPVDVTSLVQCGVNQLQVYNRDAGFAVSGVIYSATLDITECASPVEGSSWGNIKALYR
jgi:hypothetical protein